MRILLPGGSGQIGTILARHLQAAGHEVTVLSRKVPAHQHQPWRVVQWDGVTPGAWIGEVDRSDAVIHLSGKSVNCRYNEENRKAIIDSRVLPTRLLGQVIAASPTPPRIWMNASTSTIYRHSLHEPNDEYTGVLGDLPTAKGRKEPANLPETWSFSIAVANEWEQAFAASETPNTRKIRLRTSMTMSPDEGGVFSVMSNLAKFGLGGTQGSGDQMVSWIHDIDYCRATDFLLAHPEITEETNGVVNMTAPGPLPQRDFMRVLLTAWQIRVGLPATRWMLEIGAFFMRTETELILKSRYVIPGLLQDHGFEFSFPEWHLAANNLVRRMRSLK